METRRTGYGQYCPIARAVDVLGERWTLLIVRDLLVGTTHYNDLARGLPRLSRSLLSKRLRQLEDVGIVEHVDGEYHLTPAGRELEPIVFGLGEWGARWTFGDPAPDDLDAEVLVWWMHTRLDVSGWPGRRHVVHIRFSDDPKWFWIVVEDGDPSVCTTDPGYEVDVTIRSDLASLAQVWLGRVPLQTALRSGRVAVEGRRLLTSQIDDVLQLSPIAAAVGRTVTPPLP